MTIRSSGRWVAASFFLCLVFRASGAAEDKVPSSGTANQSSPQSFYVAVKAVSDASPFWFDYVIDVSIERETAKLTLLRIAPTSSECDDRVTVKAKQASIAAEEVTRFSNGLCSIHHQQVERAIEDSKPNYIQSVFDSSSYGIVEHCGERKEVIRLPLPEEVDEKKMRHKYPQIAELWNLAGHLFSVGFKGNPLSQDHGLDVESQIAAEPFIARLRSGAFDEGFSEAGAHPTLSEVLDSYRGVVSTLPSFKGAALNRDSLPLEHYVDAVYPPLARQARISGDVRISFYVDAATGTADEVSAVDGPPMLQKAAVDAVRQWRFKTLLADPPPTMATIRFELTCPQP